MDLNQGLGDKPLEATAQAHFSTKLASLFSLPGDLTGDHVATECVQKSTFKICHPERRNWKCQKKAQFMVQVPKEKEEF